MMSDLGTGTVRAEAKRKLRHYHYNHYVNAIMIIVFCVLLNRIRGEKSVFLPSDIGRGKVIGT